MYGATRLWFMGTESRVFVHKSYFVSSTNGEFLHKRVPRFFCYDSVRDVEPEDVRWHGIGDCIDLDIPPVKKKVKIIDKGQCDFVVIC